MPNSGHFLAYLGPFWPTLSLFSDVFGQFRVHLDTFEPISDLFGHVLAYFGLIWARFGLFPAFFNQFRHGSGLDLGVKGQDFGLFRAYLATFWPVRRSLSLFLDVFGQFRVCLDTFGPIWPYLATFWPISGLFGHVLAYFNQFRRGSGLDLGARGQDFGLLLVVRPGFGPILRGPAWISELAAKILAYFWGSDLDLGLFWGSGYGFGLFGGSGPGFGPVLVGRAQDLGLFWEVRPGFWPSFET